MTLAMIVAALAAIASAQQDDPTSALREEVRAAEIAFAKTMAERDHAAFISFLAADAVFLSPGRTLRGPEEIAGGWKSLYEGPQAPFSWAPERVEVLESGKLAISTGPVMNPSAVRTGTYVSTWRLEPDGRWKVVLDTGCRCNGP